MVAEKVPPVIEKPQAAKPLSPKPFVAKPTTVKPPTTTPQTQTPPVNPYTDMCRGTPTALLPHPKSCAKHVDCSKVMQGMLGDFECPFPTLWNPDIKRCDSPLAVKCGTRWEPKDACKVIFKRKYCTYMYTMHTYSSL
jgi:hypothetical protein